MAGFAASLREEMLKWMGGISATQPGDFYIQWHNGDPGADGDLNVSTGALATRTQLGGTPEWAVGTADDGQVQNSTAGNTAASAGTDSITYFSIWSASSLGTYYFSGPLDVPKAIVATDVLNWGVGDLKATLT